MKPTQKQSKLLKNILVYTISVAGAIGTGFQNYIAVFALLKEIIEGAISLSKICLGILHTIAIGLGGICSGAINFCLNVELLEDFMDRIMNKTIPTLKGWQRFRYWFGSAVFILTGLLFGLTAFAFGMGGPLAILGIVAGVLVAGIMIVQELETWLASFDDEKTRNKSLWEMFLEWKASLTKNKWLGLIITIGNVIGLSLFFTLGLASFLSGVVGVPLLPAIIVGLVVSFTGGAFTEFYFYNANIPAFCDNFVQGVKDFWRSPYSPIGLVFCAANAVVNAVGAYFSVIMLAAMTTSLLVSLGVAVPPVGICIGIAATAAVFVGLASFITMTKFWTRNTKRLSRLFEKKSKDEIEAKPYDSKAEHKASYAKLPEEEPSLGQAVIAEPIKPRPHSSNIKLRFFDKKAAEPTNERGLSYALRNSR